MKTLKKIQLKDAAVLSHYQLKQIRGGSGVSGGGSGGGSGAGGHMKCDQDDETTYFEVDECPSSYDDAVALCSSKGFILANYNASCAD